VKIEQTPQKPREEQTDHVDAVTSTSDQKITEPEKVKEPEAAEEIKTQQNDKTDETTEKQEKPNFDKEVLKNFIDLESKIKELENKDRESLRPAEYNRLVELHKALTTQGEKVEELKRQT
jgi:hypothetical protein